MRSLSLDLRWRIVALVDAGEHSLREVADLFVVDLSTVARLLHRYRNTGSVAPKPHGGGRPRKLDAETVTRLLKLVKQQPDATLLELRDRLAISCSVMTIFRALRRERISRKKKTRHATERDTPRVRKQRRTFCQKMAAVGPEHLIFVDETGATTAMSREYGRAPQGERVQATAPGAWENMTLISALRGTGVVGSLAFPGATDRPAFETYVEKVLVPELHAGDVVVWDNLSPHKSAAAKAAIEAAGARVVPLPVYSPDLSPIEEMFSKIKTGLRSLAARTVNGVMTAMGRVLTTVTQSDILGWFSNRCDYAIHS
jgi:transposase